MPMIGPWPLLAWKAFQQTSRYRSVTSIKKCPSAYLLYVLQATPDFDYHLCWCFGSLSIEEAVDGHLLFMRVP